MKKNIVSVAFFLLVIFHWDCLCCKRNFIPVDDKCLLVNKQMKINATDFIQTKEISFGAAITAKTEIAHSRFLENQHVDNALFSIVAAQRFVTTEINRDARDAVFCQKLTEILQAVNSQEIYACDGFALLFAFQGSIYGCNSSIGINRIINLCRLPSEFDLLGNVLASQTLSGQFNTIGKTELYDAYNRILVGDVITKLKILKETTNINNVDGVLFVLYRISIETGDYWLGNMIGDGDEN